MAGASTWSYDTLREKAQHENNLATDEQVLKLMVRIRRNMTSRAVTISKQMDQMLGNVDSVRVQLQNVNNKLVALQKTHFLDHRVQDDDDEPCGPADPVDDKPSKGQAEEILKKMLRETVSAVDKCYEKVVLDWSDSELEDQGDDDVIGRTMFRATDIYKDRPRPYLIGSEEWKKSKFAGLIEEKEEDVVVPEEQLSAPNPPSVRVHSEENTAVAAPPAPSVVDIQSDRPIQEPCEPVANRFFSPPDLTSDFLAREEEINNTNSVPPPQPTQPVPAPSVFFDDTPPVPTSSAAVRKKPNLFADLEDDDADDGFFASALPKGFKPQVNLFDDEPPEMEVQVHHNAPAARQRNIFDDDVDGEQRRIEGRRDRNDNVSQKAASLFGNQENEEDLFAAKSSRNLLNAEERTNEDLLNNNGQGEPIRTNQSHLDENKNPIPITTQNDTFKRSMEEMLQKGMSGEKKLNPGRPKVPHPQTEIVKEKQPERVKEAQLPVLPKDIPKPIEKAVVEPEKRKIVPKGLFDDLDDDDDDDFFAPKPKERNIETKSASIIEVPKVDTQSIKPSQSTSLGPNLLVDNDEEDDLFGPKPSHLIVESQNKSDREESPRKDLKAIASKFKSRGLFDDVDEDEDELFQPQDLAKSSQSRTPLESVTKDIQRTQSKALGDGDLFSGRPQRVLPRKATLFDSEDDNEDDIFAPKNSINSTGLVKEKEAVEEEQRKSEQAENLRIMKVKEEERIAAEEKENRRLAELKNWEEQKAAEERVRIQKLQEEERIIAAEKEEERRVKQEAEDQLKQQEQEEKARKEEEQRLFEIKEEERKRLEEIKVLAEEQQKREAAEEEIRILKRKEEERIVSEEKAKKAEEEKIRRLLEQEKLGEQARQVELRITQELERQRLEEEEQQQKRANAANLSKALDDEPVQANPPGYSNRISLFDEPPPDVDLPDQDIVKVSEESGSSDEEGLFSGKNSAPVVQQAVKKSIDLFSDLPPEDDEDELFLPAAVQNKKNVFYDDMAESFPPEEGEEKDVIESIKVPLMFNEDIPGDIPTAKKETLQSVKDIIRSHETPAELTKEVSPPKALPNKLNSNLKINVMAILPGARPTTKKSLDLMEQERKENEMSPEEPKSPELISTPTASVAVPSSSSVLSSLNKSRAKISTKRRPSTRQARQESLRRSQLFPNEVGADVEGDSDRKGVDKPSNPNNEVAVKAVKAPESSVVDKQTSRTSKSRKLFESDEDDDDLFQQGPAAIKPPVINVGKRQVPQRSSLFSDDDDDGDNSDDLFSSSSSKVSNIRSAKVPEKVIKKEAARTSTSDNPLADLL